MEMVLDTSLRNIDTKYNMNMNLESKILE